MRNRALLLFVLPFGLMLAGCESEQRKQIEALQKQVIDLSKMAADSASNIDLKAPVGEYKRLFRVEYGVFSFAASLSSAELAAELNKLGEERWDCFSVERVPADGTNLRVVCKRAPESVFRYLPPGVTSGLLKLF